MKLLKTIRLFPLVLSFIGALAMSTAPAVADDVTLKLWSGGFEKEGQRTIREVIGEFEDANTGIEIDPELADSDRSVISDQVTAGLAVRMAVIYLLSRTLSRAIR